MNTHNITIDDAFNSTSFTYQPAECSGSGWTVHKGEGYLGTYSSCTTGIGPSAAISFEGVAIYYISPYINGSSVRFKLDGTFSDDIELSTPVGHTANKTATNIFWSNTGLNNTTHLLEILPGSKNSTTLSVDAFIVTQVAAANTTVVGNIPGATGLAGAAAALAPKQTAAETRFALGLGIAFGVASFLVFIFICISLGKRRKQLRKRYSWSKPVPPLRPTTIMYSHHATGFTSGSPVGSPKEDDDAGLVLEQLPSVPHGSFTTNDDDVATTRGWGSPTPSNRNLLSSTQRSSHGQLADAQPLSRNTVSTIKLEPVRHLDNAPSLSRNTTASTTRLEPLRQQDNAPSLSRNTTTSTTRFEPVRKVQIS